MRVHDAGFFQAYASDSAELYLCLPQRQDRQIGRARRISRSASSVNSKFIVHAEMLGLGGGSSGLHNGDKGGLERFVQAS